MTRPVDEILAELKEAQASAVDDHIAAKEAHRANPSEETRAAQDATGETLQALRAAERGNRPLGVVGDVFVHEDPDARDNSPQAGDRNEGSN